MIVGVEKLGRWDRFVVTGGAYGWDERVHDWVRIPKQPTVYASKHEAEQAFATAKPLAEFITTVTVIVKGHVELEALRRLLAAGARVTLRFDHEANISASIEEIAVDWNSLFHFDESA